VRNYFFFSQGKKTACRKAGVDDAGHPAFGCASGTKSVSQKAF